MDSGGVVQSRVHESDQHHPYSVGLKQGEQHYGADEHHHDQEKKSVLKKVKAKAKKIKDTIKKHAHHDDHDHNHEHHEIPDDHDLDEEDDEDEDMVESPEVHGAPIYDSTVARTVIPGEQVHHQEPKVVVVSSDIGTQQTVANDSATRTFAGDEVNAGQRKFNLQKPIDLEEDPAAPGTTHQPHTASNYQRKVTDPTGAGAAEIHVTPVLKSFADMDIHDGTKPHVRSTATQYPSGTPMIQEQQKHYESVDKPSNQSSYTATQYPSATPIMHEEQKHFESMEKPSNQSSYIATPYPSGASEMHVDQKRYESLDKPSNQSSYTSTQYPSGTSEMQVDQKRYESVDQPSNQSSYSDKISSATSAIADKAFTAKNVIASKLGYDDNKGNREHENEGRPGENQSSYTDKISYATSAIADKAVAAKNAVASKLGYGDNKVDRDNEKDTRQGENQSSYTQKISSTTSAIADKAASAKNAVTAKLGYGSGVGDNARTTREDYVKTEDANASGMSGASTAEYGKKITESMTEKLAPVYGKVAGVGSAVKSKLSPSTKEADKGVSVKEYFAEKLRPGDEDRALSEVITEALHKRGGKTTVNERGDHEGRRMTDVVSDVIHERDEGVTETEHRPLGKVTESEEVKRRLGGESGTKYEESYENSSGKGVVGKLKDVAGSWFGTSQENQSSQDTGRVGEASN